MNDSTQLVVMQQPLRAVDIFDSGNGVIDILGKVDTEVTEARLRLGHDLTDPGTRAEIASLAYKIARSKTALDELGKDYVADLKRRSSGIDGQRRLIRDRLDRLRNEVRAPLTAWEQAEAARTAVHEALLDEIERMPATVWRTVAAIEERLTKLAQVAERDWQEYADRATLLVSVTRDKLNAALADARVQEERDRELDRLRAENAARLAAEHAAAAKAREDERVKEAAEAAVRQERAEAERRAAAIREQEAAQARIEERRAANLNHRRRVNREAAEGLSKVLDELPIASLDNAELAKRLIEAIVLERLPHVAIRY